MKKLLPISVIILVGLLLSLSTSLTRAEPGQSLKQARTHWAFQPLTNPSPPRVKAKKRVQTPIDSFLLSKLEEKGLGFAPPVDKRTLLRRVYYDLTGLPPTFEEIQAFERDRSRDVFAKVVDRLLASPRYGERWGRHWLDIARYAETKDLVLSYGKDALRPYAYTYRDYVIRAFNEDLPYNQFVQDQLAADLAEPKIPQWHLSALGFLTLGRLFDNNPHDQIDDQIDTTTRGFLALTVACARCHDHKYDAIWQADYYSLYGVFASTERPYDLPLLENPTNVPGGVEFEEKLAKARKELDQLIDAEFTRLTENFRQRLGDYLVRAATTQPDISETAQFGLSLIPEDFRPTLVQRTRRLIEERANPADHAFGPWAELMALPDEDFAAQATNKLASLTTPRSQAASASASGAQAKPAPHNPLVLEALSKSALTNKAAVARAYGNLLVATYGESKKPAAGNPHGPVSPDQQELLALVTSQESPIWFPRRDTPLHLSRPEADKCGQLISNLDKIAAHATNAPPARAMVVADLPEPYEPHIFKRGNPSRLGDPVPRAFVRLLTGGESRAFKHGSGRLELAQSIVSPSNPLTARVLVNRVWMWHFGEPLVSSTTDFGVRSTPPSNPELLDWLATEFIRSAWSLKHLHRVILLSAAWQQAGAAPNSIAKNDSDPENKLLSHFSRRRLDFESLRDSLLFVSGRLDPKMSGPPVDIATDAFNQRRTVYGLIDRQNLPGLYRAFDFPIPDQCIERRSQTTVPQQALFALNSPFVMEQAKALANRTEITQTTSPAEKVSTLFRLTLGRQATKSETAAALRFIESTESEADSTDQLKPWEQFAQVLLVSNEAVFLD